MPDSKDSPIQPIVRQLFAWLYAAQNAIDAAIGLRPPISALLAAIAFMVATFITYDLQGGVVAALAAFVTASLMLVLIDDEEVSSHVSHLRNDALARASELAEKRRSEEWQRIADADARRQILAASADATDSPLRCPICMSTHIHAGPRGWTFWSGLLGSGNTVLTCLKCGRRFKPGAM